MINSNITIQYISPLASAARVRDEHFRDRREKQGQREEPAKDEAPDPAAHRVDITV